MITPAGFCCGSIPPKKNNTQNLKTAPNPPVKNGAEIIYLGAGNFKITATSSGNTYYASDHQRNIKVEKQDLKELLQHPELIQKP